MFKTGIIQPEELNRPYTWLGKYKPIAYTLLNADVKSMDEKIRIFEGIIKDVKLTSGIYCTTYSQRFCKLDEVVLEILKSTFSRRFPLLVHDWGVSNGLTSLEWLNNLLVYFKQVKIVASDILFYLIRADSPSKKTWILEPNGEALQYIHSPFVLSFLKPESWFYPVNRLLLLWGRRKLNELKLIVSERRWEDIRDSSVILSKGWTIQKILLVHPFAWRAFLEGRMDFEIHNAFTPISGKCHVLRTMNLYNRCYFPISQIKCGIAAVLSSLKEHGVWIIGRTKEETDGEICATVFQKEHNKFIPLTRLGGGSDIEDLIMNCNCSG